MVLVGAEDEAVDANGLPAVFAAGAPHADLAVLPNTTHFGVLRDPLALRQITEWLAALPPA